MLLLHQMMRMREHYGYKLFIEPQVRHTNQSHLWYKPTKSVIHRSLVCKEVSGRRNSVYSLIMILTWLKNCYTQSNYISKD